MISQLLLALFLGGYPFQAWDGAASGKISLIQFTEAENFGIRVSLGDQPMCNDGPNWAYMNKSWNNYEATLSGILMAYGSNKTVLIHSRRDAGGYCRIGHFSMGAQ